MQFRFKNILHLRQEESVISKKVLFLTIIFFMCVNIFPSFSQEIDSLKSRLENMQGTEKIKMLNELAGRYWELPPNDRIAFAEQAIDLENKFHDPKSKAESYNHLGVAYNNLGDSNKSMDYFLKALKIMEQINDKSGIARSYINIGQANFYMDNFDKALEKFLQALNINKEIGDKKSTSQSLILLGNVKAKTEKYDEALAYYFKALGMKKEIDDKIGISQIYNNIGNIYLETGKMEKVLEYRLKALKIDREINNKWEISLTTYNLAEYYLKVKQPEKAYPYILESIKIAQQLDNKGLIRDNLYNYSLYYEQTGDFKKALKYQRKYSEFTKNIYSEELSGKITEMQIKYETEKKEKENQTYKLKLEKNRSDRMQLYLLLTAALLTSFIFYYRYRIKKRAALLLEISVAERTQELRQSFNEIEQAKLQIQKELKEKEILLRELYHRTKNNMQVICSMLRLQASRLKDHGVKNIFKEIETKIHSMALVHQKLIKSKDLSHINLKDYFDSLILLIEHSYIESDQDISFHTDMENINVLIDTAVPLGLVFNELISNAAKHAFPEKTRGEIKVHLYLGPQKEIVLEISDNGIGLPKGFEIPKDIHLGLETAIDLIEHQLDGKIDFKSRNGLHCKIVLKEELYKPRI